MIAAATTAVVFHTVLNIDILYVQEVVTQPKILNRTFLSNIIHVT